MGYFLVRKMKVIVLHGFAEEQLLHWLVRQCSAKSIEVHVPRLFVGCKHCNTKKVVSLRECIHSTTASVHSMMRTHLIKFTAHSYCRERVMPQGESVFLWANKAEKTTSCL